MIEIHCHILPETDDGAADLEESLTMLRRMKKDGVTHVVATPHCTRTAPLFRGDITARVEKLRHEMQRAGLESIAIFPGSEISFFDAAQYRDNYQSGQFCHLGGNNEYSLLEFPWTRADIPAQPLAHIEWMLAQGTTPILAHPERTPFLRENPLLLKQMHDTGAWIQITVDSVSGRFDSSLASLCALLIDKFERVVIATDSHNLRRCSSLSEGYKTVAQKFGQDRAHDLWQRADLVRASVERAAEESQK